MGSNRSLRVLLVEDSPDDATLIERQLRRYGFRPEVERVETADSLVAALDRMSWDILILDYSLPRFGALQAIALLKERGVDLPAIIVSGAVGEENAVDAMKAGADDFIRKDNWSRLGPAIERELQEAENRRERRRAEEERALLLAEREAERNWLEAVIENSPVGIIRIDDLMGRRVVANRRAEELFGRPLPPEGGIAQYVGQIYRTDGQMRASEDLATWRALQGETVAPEAEVLRQPDGREVQVLVSAEPIRAGGALIGAVVAYQDVTLLRELERLRDEWNSIIVHDLRQPVTVITGYAELLKRHFAQDLGERGGWVVEQILPAARRLDRMVGDLLDSSRIEAHHLQLELETVDLVTLVGDVVAGLSTPDHPINVVVAGPIPPLVVDPTRIVQVVGNLLSNAGKYGEMGTEILLEVAACEDEVEVAVTNRGAGIAPEDLPRLFTRFYRTKRAQADRIQGLGLGLYICKGLVEAHGGRIWAESTLGEATTFRFSLPVRPLEERARSSTPEE